MAAISESFSLTQSQLFETRQVKVDNTPRFGIDILIEERMNAECPTCHSLLCVDLLNPGKPADYCWGRCGEYSL